MVKHAFSAAVVIAALLFPGLALAQAAGGSALRPEWNVEASRAGRAHVVGYVYNHSATMDAANVRLRVERLSPDGRVNATYQGRVVGDVLQGGRLAFDVPVPEPTSPYRVIVESADWFRECR